MKVGSKQKALVAGKIRTIHIRGIVDDMIVYKWWRRGKQRWEYAVESETFITFAKGMWRCMDD